MQVLANSTICSSFQEKDLQYFIIYQYCCPFHDRDISSLLPHFENSDSKLPQLWILCNNLLVLFRDCFCFLWTSCPVQLKHMMNMWSLNVISLNLFLYLNIELLGSAPFEDLSPKLGVPNAVKCIYQWSFQLWTTGVLLMTSLGIQKWKVVLILSFCFIGFWSPHFQGSYNISAEIFPLLNILHLSLKKPFITEWKIFIYFS